MIAETIGSLFDNTQHNWQTHKYKDFGDFHGHIIQKHLRFYTPFEPWKPHPNRLQLNMINEHLGAHSVVGVMLPDHTSEEKNHAWICTRYNSDTDTYHLITRVWKHKKVVERAVTTRYLLTLPNLHCLFVHPATSI